ncbi:MAG: winged helix-turn-helix transcriptional regulator [Phycisphaerales bacterium]|nr:winged helix-turn-helix transcriptional regulator [Phycisphaerales bacterium]
MDHRAKRRYEKQARIIAALAHPTRVAIADLLRDEELCVQDIADRVGAQRPNVSQHLSVMLRGGLVQTRKDGLLVFYSLRTPCILGFLDCACRVLEDGVREDAELLEDARPRGATR